MKIQKRKRKIKLICGCGEKICGWFGDYIFFYYIYITLVWFSRRILRRWYKCFFICNIMLNAIDMNKFYYFINFPPIIDEYDDDLLMIIDDYVNFSLIYISKIMYFMKNVYIFIIKPKQQQHHHQPAIHPLTHPHTTFAFIQKSFLSHSFSLIYLIASLFNQNIRTYTVSSINIRSKIKWCSTKQISKLIEY